MSKSNISRLAKSISSKHGLTQAEAERFISKMFEVANEGLHEDKLLKIKWLGTFKVTPVKDRESVDVNTGERIVIEGRDKISFTPDNILKEIVNSHSPSLRPLSSMTVSISPTLMRSFLFRLFLQNLLLQRCQARLVSRRRLKRQLVNRSQKALMSRKIPTNKRLPISQLPKFIQVQKHNRWQESNRW